MAEKPEGHPHVINSERISEEDVGKVVQFIEKAWCGDVAHMLQQLFQALSQEWPNDNINAFVGTMPTYGMYRRKGKSVVATWGNLKIFIFAL